MLAVPFYDPLRSYQENFDQGPFGAFAEPDVYQSPGQPTSSFLGHPVYLPFGIPAGPLINGNYVRAALAKGFDIVVYKTVRSREFPCHPHPNVLSVDVDGDLTLKKAAGALVASDHYAEPLSITNSFGVPSMNPDRWQADLSQVVKSTWVGQLVVGSFQGTRKDGGSVSDLVADYVTTAQLVAETGVDVMIANLSCPNEGTGNLVCFDLPTVVSIASQVKNKIGNKKLLLKLAYFPGQEQLKQLVTQVGSVIDGLVAINTIPAGIVTATGVQALPGEGRAVSGVCGAAIKWAGLEMTSRLVALRQELGLKFAVVGVGGVMNEKDFAEYRKLGADAVLSATGAMWNPSLAQQIKTSLGLIHD